MGSQVEPVKEVGLVSSSEPKPVETEMEARVAAMWEQMNKGVSNKIVKPFSNKGSSSTVNSSPQKLNDSWMTYLGLATKEFGSPAQDAHMKGPDGERIGASDEEKKIVALWEQMNNIISNKKFKSSAAACMSNSTVDKNLQKKSDNWMTYLGMATKKAECPLNDVPQDEPNGAGNSSDEVKKLAAAALSAVKDATATASARGKVEITEVRDFAGQEIEVKKLVEAESKEAAEKAKASAPSAVDAVLEQIRKKPKLSVLDKTKKDWGEFKEDNKGLEEELDAYKKSSNQYLEKVSFLQRADYREFERERDARLAVQARRQPDMREDS
uniref:BCNT-C domain-containing protein n=2 Tax=Rhizophora mucronata TaxID=61149 RepID=A0A2P2KAN2_RHIMU